MVSACTRSDILRNKFHTLATACGKLAALLTASSTTNEDASPVVKRIQAAWAGLLEQQKDELEPLRDLNKALSSTSITGTSAEELTIANHNHHVLVCMQCSLVSASGSHLVLQAGSMVAMSVNRLQAAIVELSTWMNVLVLHCCCSETDCTINPLTSSHWQADTPLTLLRL